MRNIVKRETARGAVNALPLSTLRLFQRNFESNFPLSAALVIAYLNACGGARQRDIADWLSIPRATVSRHLINLKATKWVTEDDTGRWHLTQKWDDVWIEMWMHLTDSNGRRN